MLEFTQGGMGYTREQAPGALANGTRVVKKVAEPNDAHIIGDKATVIGSIAVPDEARKRDDDQFFYFVEWDDMPGLYVGVVSYKIEEVRTLKLERTFGLLDTQDKLWLGDMKGPHVFTGDKAFGETVAKVANVKLGWPEGRVRATVFLPGELEGIRKMRDTVESVMTIEEAMKKIEEAL